MESIIKVVLDNNYTELQSYFDEKVTENINNRIESAKIDVLAKMNNVTRDQMEEIINVSK